MSIFKSSIKKRNKQNNKDYGKIVDTFASFTSPSSKKIKKKIEDIL